MKREIKAGDYVYIPTHSKSALEVFELTDDTDLRVFLHDDELFIDFNSDGKSSRYHIEPIAFLATPANKARIEQFYGCELENPPTFRMATLTIPHENS